MFKKYLVLPTIILFVAGSIIYKIAFHLSMIVLALSAFCFFLLIPKDFLKNQEEDD